MNFEHTEDRRMLADTLNRYVAQQYGFETRDQIATSTSGFSIEHWHQFAELGAVGALFDAADGGYGGTGFDITVVFEALGRGLVVEPMLGALTVGSAIARSGSAQQQTSLDRIIAGEEIAAFAHYEPASGHAITEVGTTAVRSEQGWVLNGMKAVVDHAEAATLFLISARTSGDKDSEHGISLFLVPSNTSGIAVRALPAIDGGRVAELELEDLHVPESALLGVEDQALATLEHAIGRGLLALCSESLGAMDVARQATLEYLQTRKQFGVPIGSFQALQHRMADVLLEIEQARSAVINAAALLGSGDRLVREKALSAAKFTIGRAGALVAEESIQMHGGIGMTRELPLSHYAKRLIMLDHQLGDEDFHLQRFIDLDKETP